MQRRCALILGIIFLVLGIAGFIPGLVSLPASNIDAGVPLSVDNFYAKGFGLLFGLFPTNLMHNIVHLLVGILGLVAANTESSARLYNRGFAVAYILIALMGLLPFAQTTFGLMPIFGNNVWFNALTGLVAGYIGFAVEPEEPTRIGT
ncbi:unknown protein [Stanieria sp. NIES-3757]|nr:unknown protein [Stanieria sp. NIES-3757]